MRQDWHCSEGWGYLEDGKEEGEGGGEDYHKQGIVEGRLRL